MFKIKKFRQADKIAVLIEISTKDLMSKILEGMTEQELNDLKSIDLVPYFDDSLGEEISDVLQKISRSNYCTEKLSNKGKIKNEEFNAKYNIIKMYNSAIGHGIDFSTYKTKGKRQSIPGYVFQHIKHKLEEHVEHGSYDEFVVSKKAIKTIKKISKKDKDDNDVSTWTSNQWYKYMNDKFVDIYGQQSLELLAGNSSKRGKGIIWLKIKNNLIKVFQDMGKTNYDLKGYVDWCFDVKASEIKFPMSLNFMCSPTLIQEYVISGKKRVPANGNKSGKLSKNIVKI